MTAKDECGVCIFAYNNEKLDYIKFAHIAAKYIKKNTKYNKTCLITDESSKDWMDMSVDSTFHKECFDYVVTDEVKFKHNPRRHYDSPWSTFTAQFSNSNKDDIINLTPFEKTLLIDSDYIVQNNFYDYIFETDIPFAIHKTAEYLDHKPPRLPEQELNEAGIHHWWSTVVYFDQSDESKLFFDIWSHVKENWEYYSILYQFPKNLFRTDFCVSIAAHIMNGYNDFNFVHDFLSVPLVNADQKDDLVKINGVNDWVFMSADREVEWKTMLVRKKDANVHVMNKMAINRHADEILDSFIKENA